MGTRGQGDLVSFESKATPRKGGGQSQYMCRGPSLIRNYLPPPGPPQGSRIILTVGSWGSEGRAFSYERGTPVLDHAERLVAVFDH